MKLEILAEAGYHRDPNEQFLNRFFQKEDGDDEHEWWSVKEDYLIVLDLGDGQSTISHVIVDTNDHSNYELFDGMHNELDTWKFDSLIVYKRVTGPQ